MEERLTKVFRNLPKWVKEKGTKMCKSVQLKFILTFKGQKSSKAKFLVLIKKSMPLLY